MSNVRFRENILRLNDIKNVSNSIYYFLKPLKDYFVTHEYDYIKTELKFIQNISYILLIVVHVA